MSDRSLTCALFPSEPARLVTLGRHARRHLEPAGSYGTARQVAAYGFAGQLLSVMLLPALRSSRLDEHDR